MKRICFFIKGPQPTPRQKLEARLLGPNVCFRNTLFIDPETPKDKVELFSGAAGEVPKCYKHLPNASEVAEKEKAELEKLIEADEAEIKALEKAEKTEGSEGWKAN